MFTSLASILLLGTVAPPPIKPVPRPLPGIEVMNVASPHTILNNFEMPPLSASGVVLIDRASGQELYAKDPDTERPMASLTKIMTALVLLETRSMNDILTVPPIAEQMRGSTLGLKAGERMSAGNALRAVLLPSANDAAYVIAANDPSGMAGFVHKMNERAQTLGLQHTRFANPAGLDSPQQYSSAHDIAWLTLAALKDPAFASTVQMRFAKIATQEGREFDLRNTNEMLHYNEDVYGVKTGTTDEAKECLVVLFQEGSREYLLVLLGSNDRYNDGLLVLKALHEAVQK